MILGKGGVGMGRVATHGIVKLILLLYFNIVKITIVIYSHGDLVCRRSTEYIFSTILQAQCC